jgi:hypothetical protein
MRERSRMRKTMIIKVKRNGQEDGEEDERKIKKMGGAYKTKKTQRKQNMFYAVPITVLLRKPE